MTGKDAFDRATQLHSYIDLLQTLHREKSNFNLEFGEGNPQAVLISSLMEELIEELDTLLKRLKNVVID